MFSLAAHRVSSRTISNYTTDVFSINLDHSKADEKTEKEKGERVVKTNWRPKETYLSRLFHLTGRITWLSTFILLIGLFTVFPSLQIRILRILTFSYQIVKYSISSKNYWELRIWCHSALQLRNYVSLQINITPVVND